jgi:hypothetical protein
MISAKLTKWTEDEMLLEFRASNYKSFKDEFVFSLMPAPKQKGLDFSILQNEAGHRALSSSIIYGPNASGKTNIIGAMEVFKTIVSRGHIRNADSNGPNHAVGRLELIPNKDNPKSEPVKFAIKFEELGMLFDYSAEFALGSFLDYDFPRKILKEALYLNGDLYFERTDRLRMGSHCMIYNDGTSAKAVTEDNYKMIAGIVESNLNDTELFLTNGYKVLFDARFASMLTTWLERKFLVVYRSDALGLPRGIPDNQAVSADPDINQAAKHFGINSSELNFVQGEGEDAGRLSSLVAGNGHTAILPAEEFESYGTIRFISSYPYVSKALANGGTLVVDEFDASIHPMAVMNIINIFHNDEINVNHAQLVFNSHNPIFLNKNIFRRDEIKFVERDDMTQSSSLYALSDFGTAGKNGVRKNEDYMKNYYIDRYGAIKDIDFSPVFEEMLTASPRR